LRNFYLLTLTYYLKKSSWSFVHFVVKKQLRISVCCYRTLPDSRIMRRISSSNGTEVGEIVQLNPLPMQYFCTDSRKSANLFL